MATGTISIITPTLGRPTLEHTAVSLLPQLGPGDEWLIVGDGPQPLARRLVASIDDRRVSYAECVDRHSAYGNAQRNAAMQRATGEFLMFVDDDDVLLDGALDAVRREAVHGVPLMFRMRYEPRKTVLWRVPQLREANIGGGMFVPPNRLDRLAAWPIYDRPTSPLYRASDFTFIAETLRMWPSNSLRWCRDVIYWCQKHGRGQ